jgi:hypothetical protein
MPRIALKLLAIFRIEGKIALLNMAQVWLALADDVERKASSEVLHSAEEL